MFHLQTILCELHSRMDEKLLCLSNGFIVYETLKRMKGENGVLSVAG